MIQRPKQIHIELTQTEQLQSVFESCRNTDKCMYKQYGKPLWSGILDSLHDPSSQLKCLHDEAPEANPGSKMVASYPPPRILMKTNMSSMYETLIRHNLRWAGHLIWLDNTRKEGHRNVGRPKLHFKNTIKRNLARKGISPGSWDNKANNRPLWRELIRRKLSSDMMDSK